MAGELGFEALRVDDIVLAAGTSHGTFYLYFYFSSREDLLGTLIPTRRCHGHRRERVPADWRR